MERAALPAVPEAIRGRSPLLVLGEGAHGWAHDLAGALLLGGERVTVADGSNGLDAYAIARTARAARRPPSALLAALRVSRAFTWQQYAVLLEERVAEEARRSSARFVLALGPLDLLADEEVGPLEARRAAERTAAALAALGRAGLGVVAAQAEGALRRARRDAGGSAAAARGAGRGGGRLTRGTHAALRDAGVRG
jgi:hypothetical protein